ncbi:hsp70-Hsp90 organizing protein 1-like isoform X1 [Thalassophryne amazonica]|uniref:hsp70-Hsp90 organizing protein 1-like isoform X1 n=1 Tax=Thalassophryne amazonica TaxID=390379 RepID=UPI0014718AB7|nr:hsp70-Hsp90 organizing protein 1-like isoform X1 [Thalassophryne amazonica]
MAIYYDDPEIIELQMMQRVVSLFDRRPHMQRIIRFGLAGMNYSDELDDSGPEHSRLRFLEAESDDSDDEAKEKLHKSKKRTGKAEKKRLKKQKQKERKRLEKLKKEELNPSNVEEKGDTQPSESGSSKPVDRNTEGSASVKELVSSRDTDGSDFSQEESIDGECKDESDQSEELDLTSTFVNKAALIAKRKLEQKLKVEKEKKVPIKETNRPVGNQTSEDKGDEKKVSATITGRTLEDNVKISTDLAVIGNKFASTGEFRMAVKYFTDAIKYNPTEYKLFGNRSFCFEKMQEYEKALTDAELCLSMFPGWVKGLYRKGRALAGLKRYEEAAETFTEVLKLDSSCAEAAQELMWVQVIQLMEYGFSREQSSNALIIHGTVKKALEVLSTLNNHPGVVQNSSLPPVQVANINGVSPVLSANANSPVHSHNAPDKPLSSKPLASMHNTSTVQNQSEAVPDHVTKAKGGEIRHPLELFPVWVGNIVSTVTEPMLMDLFSKAGIVHSVKLLLSKRCAFVNFTKQEYCDEAIKQFHGFELKGIKVVVRYPDRIPQGMGISKSALKAEDLQDENMRQMEYFHRSNGGYWRPRPIRSYRHVSDHRK